MLKLYDKAITFSEFPDEISLCLNISNCPGHCSHCSEPWLLEDIGTEITARLIDELIKKHPGITLIGFMGGDNSHEDIYLLAQYIHSKGLKVGMYSGQEYLDMKLLEVLDCYKIGRWIMPTGPVEEWSKQNCGPLKFTFSNQLYFERKDDKWINATYKFRSEILNNLEKEIIK